MLIKESTLRRIIREEARRALREDDAAVPTPVAAPAPVPAPAKPPLTDPALIETMIKSRLKASRFIPTVNRLKNEHGADYIEGHVEFTFDILTTGLVDRNTIKVKASRQTYQKEIEAALKSDLISIRFDPIMSPVIGRTHALSIPPGDV